MRVVVRVQPGAKRTFVGGRYGDSEPPVLVIRVQAPAVDGKANQAVIQALANELGLAKTALRIVTGHASRTKTLEIQGVTPDDLLRLLER